MSLFGKQTIAETRHLMNTIEFRIERVGELVNRLEFNEGNLQLVKDWDVWNERWDAARERVLDRLLGKKLAQPLVSDSLIEAQSEFDIVMKAKGTPAEVIALPSLITRFEAATGQRLNETDAPMPEGFDPDLAAYKKVDEQIKNGEAAAKAAGQVAGQAAKSNTGIIVLGGVGLVLAGGVLAKVYL